jgi:hypothetical protein
MTSTRDLLSKDTSIGGISYRNIDFNTSRKKYNLSDLRKNEEFNKTTERFLKSIGEGDSVADLFSYFRGADYNLADGLSVLSQSKKFTDQQKKDYQYLRSKFDNADMGGFSEWVSGISSIAGDVITDPTVIASMLFVPWTGGASAATRLAGSKAVQLGLKKLTNKEIAEATAKGISKLPGQKLKEPLSKKTQTALLSTEGFLYGSTNNATTQNIDINTDRKNNYSVGETLTAGAIGAALPVVIRGVGIGASKGYNKFNDSVQQRRANRIDGGEDYKMGVYDYGVDVLDSIADYVVHPINRRTSFLTRQFLQKPTSRFVEKMKLDKGLDKLIKIFRYDTDRSMSAAGFDAKMPVSERSYYELVNNDIGLRNEKLTAFLDPLYKRGKIDKPTVGSRDAFFKVPRKVKKYFGYEDLEKTKKSYSSYQRISNETNDALVYYLRTGRKTITVDGKRVNIVDAFKVTENTLDEIITAGNGIRSVMTEIRNDAISKGLKIGKIDKYLPRGWRYSRVQDELDNFRNNGVEGKLIKELKAKYPNLGKTVDGVTSETKIINLLEDLIDPTSTANQSFLELATVGKGEVGAKLKRAFFKSTPALTKERKLSKLNDAVISDYLDGSVENLLANYVHQASGFIRRKELFGEDLVEFGKKHIQPIRKRLQKIGKDLSPNELAQLEDLYLVTTGQISRPKGAIGTFFNDVALVGNQLALLPFATITSFSEIAVPLVRGAGKKSFQKGTAESGIDKGGIKVLWETANDYRKMWWNDVWTKELRDARPEAMRELNRFNRAMGAASEDRALAMFGQGFSRRATRLQNTFFKYNLLHDWTRFVQLTSFNVGKSKIYDNLYELATNKTIAGSIRSSKKLSSKRKIRLENELKELGVDVTAGIKWVKAGGKNTSKFYNESLLPSAARYVDEVIMNPTAAANQKPLWHSMPGTRWAFGLLGFPTAFSNTVIKNAIREINKDVRHGTLGKTGQIGAGVTTMVGIAMFGNTLRSRGANLEKIEEGESTLFDEIKDAAIRTGLVGPTEYAIRIQQTSQYDNLLKSITQRLTGPAVSDLLFLLEDWNGPLSLALNKVPAISALRSTNPETFKELKKLAREADKSMGFTASGKKKEKPEVVPRPLFTEGGFVEGEYEVPNTKENPAERINPYTGEPYEGLLLEDLPFFNLDIRQTFNEGGLSEEERERLTLQAQELMKLDPPLQQTAPVIELLVAGVPRIIYGVGKTGFNLINTLAKESVKKPKPVNYYHGSNLKLKEVTPMGDRATAPDVKDLFQQASYIAKPGDRGLELANFYARGGGFVNVIGKKQFDEVVKKLYNPRNISNELKDKVTKEISMRQAFITRAKTEKVNRNKLRRARRDIVDLEALIKPFGSGYISRITPVQRKFLEREGFDGVDVSDDVVAIFRKVPVKGSIRGSLTQRLIDRKNKKN